MLIEITRTLQIDSTDLEEIFVTATGPGGQNVNKTATAVQLRFNLGGNTTLPAPVKARLARLAGRRLSRDGILTIEAETYRSQPRNREAARDKLFSLIRAAATQPKTRRPTKPTKAAQTRRLETKSRRGALKRQRGAQEFS
jgi:ribosome-associated protein